MTVTPGPRQTPWKRSFNPFRTDADARWPAPAGVYEPMLVYNRATASFLPWLAAKYDWSPDNLKLRFSLRSGVTWSDGAAFSSGDVAFTFDLLRRFPALDRAGVWGFSPRWRPWIPPPSRFTLKRPFRFPSRFRPYASALPGGADALPVLVEVKAR